MPLTSEAVRALGDVRLMHRMWVAGWKVDPLLLPFRVMEWAMAEALLSDMGWFNRHNPNTPPVAIEPPRAIEVDPDKVKID